MARTPSTLIPACHLRLNDRPHTSQNASFYLNASSIFPNALSFLAFPHPHINAYYIWSHITPAMLQLPLPRSRRWHRYHTDISALAGHDGYGPPGADDVGHYLHHAHFECNYGFSFPNYLDRLAGTYEDGARFLKLRQ